MLDQVLQIKGEAKKGNNKIVEYVKYNLYILAHNGSGFDSAFDVVLNILPQWRTVVGSGIVSLIIFNGYVDQNKKVSDYVHFRSGRIHIINSLKL